jgi:hypothetical protein
MLPEKEKICWKEACCRKKYLKEYLVRRTGSVNFVVPNREKVRKFFE